MLVNAYQISQTMLLTKIDPVKVGKHKHSQFTHEETSRERWTTEQGMEHKTHSLSCALTTVLLKPPGKLR